MRCSSVRRHLAVQVHRQARRRADPSASARNRRRHRRRRLAPCARRRHSPELQRLDVSVLEQRHAPTDGSRALTRPSLTCVCMCVCVCVCVCVRVCVCVCACVTSHGSALLPSALLNLAATSAAPPTPSVSGDPSARVARVPIAAVQRARRRSRARLLVMEAKESQEAAAGRSTQISTQPRRTHPPFLPPMRGGMVLAGHYSAHHTGTSSHGPIMVLDSEFCQTKLT